MLIYGTAKSCERIDFTPKKKEKKERKKENGMKGKHLYKYHNKE